MDVVGEAPSAQELPSTSYDPSMFNGPVDFSNALLDPSTQQLVASIYQHPSVQLNILKGRLKVVAQNFQPAIFKRRSAEAEVFQEMGIRVLDWQQLKRQSGGLFRPSSSSLPISRPATRRQAVEHHITVPRDQRHMPKLSRAIKAKSNGSGRTYTSKYRGVHQTFPTKRWEAQFRRNGKPTSLGCFDHEEEAARAYDKMMLWCELHNTAGVKGGITNFDPSEYEKELPWLQSISQDELIENLRSDGRRQAAHRMLRQKREGQVSHTDDDMAQGSG